MQTPDLLLVNKPGLTQFLPCHSKSFRKAAAHPAFSSVAALTYQAQKWPEFCFLLPTGAFPLYLLPLMIQSQRINIQSMFFWRVRQEKKTPLCLLSWAGEEGAELPTWFFSGVFPAMPALRCYLLGKGEKCIWFWRKIYQCYRREDCSPFMLFFSAICSNALFFQHLSYWFKSSLAGTLNSFCLVCNLNLLWLEQKPEFNQGLN